MNSLFYDIVGGPTIEEIINDVKTIKPDQIVIFSETEWYSNFLDEQLANVCNQNNVRVKITFCSFPHQFYENQIKLFDHIDIQYWPTFWANWTLMCSNQLNFDITYEKFDYPFICLNNRNHLHRCALIDQLGRNNLLDTGIVTWHRFPNQHKSNYDFKYYDDSIRLIDDNFNTILDSFLIPDQYHKSFLHVIGEATLEVACISEKTYLPILYKKPFIILGIEGFHKHLLDLGFELYDEIIDYSFDNEPDMQKRAYAISENVKQISEQNVNDLYQLIKEKTIRNYNNYMRILHDASYVPDLIKERILALHQNPNLKMTFTDPRYLHIGRDTKIIC